MSKTILETIYAQRKEDLELVKSLVTEQDLLAIIDRNSNLKPLNFYDRLKQNDGERTSVIAEVKRASPSKGDISLYADAVAQGLKYAIGGADGISVLTEPKWFKGHVNDMMSLRLELENYVSNSTLKIKRPGILRKEFIFDRYQVLEARAYGADSLLLIVKMLSDQVLADLLSYSRELGLEPLVEVNNVEEMQRAKAVGAKLIGVNNRNLHTFDVDMSRTSALSNMVDEGVILAALSGIVSRKDVETYEKENVKAILVGETLMRAECVTKCLSQLVGKNITTKQFKKDEGKKTIVKTCGIRSVEDAIFAARNRVDMIGIIFVPNTTRFVDSLVGRSIVDAVRAEMGFVSGNNCQLPVQQSNMDIWCIIKKPLIVGVFRNQTIESILSICNETGIDVIQLHDDDINKAKIEKLQKTIQSTNKNFKLIHVCHISESENLTTLDAKLELLRSLHVLPLLDTKTPGGGGAGVAFDWKFALKMRERGHQFLVAGGLTPVNVKEAIDMVKPWGVDVSSGTETDGKKDLQKIASFIDVCK